jgi:hypothetical protein
VLTGWREKPTSTPAQGKGDTGTSAGCSHYLIYPKR